MKKINVILLLAILIAGGASSVFAGENIGQKRLGAPAGGSLAAVCKPSRHIINLDLNNVRCPILMNGDMWWDAINNISRYEIPKGSGKTSLFAGAIWIGGRDNSGNLKVAAQTYRQSGSDFWPGPLDTTTTSTELNQCLKYDNHWKLTRQQVQDFVTWFKEGTPANYVIPADILTWPGNGDATKNEGHYLAPFYDNNNDGIYNPYDGDYPDFDLSAQPTCGHLYGDQNIWWVFNDQGNIHTETGGVPIGVEIRAQAFCFQTNDEINNMTFYNYQIINRSSTQVNSCWFGAWADPDLGYNFDDFVGCDVTRGLGYVYNGDANDQGSYGYGANPPACGLDFFQGPVADTSDGLDNDRDGIIDETGEEIIMSQFVYYNNDFTDIGNPFTAAEYYNYLQGIWKDGTHITYGGDGHLGTTPTNFMFPGNTNPKFWDVNGVPGANPGPLWTEETAGNTPADRRFLQSAGKFTLQAGAVNYITTGAVWAKTTQGGPFASVALLQLADDKAQALFNNCFAITNGPDAPDMTIRELDKELILSIKPSKTGNDSIETNYIEKNPFIQKSQDTVYRFQGYQIYQFKDNSVSIADIHDISKARLVAQCDIKDTVSQIVNQTFSTEINAFIPREEVNGANKGLSHTFRITTDAFATGETNNLINHQTYYFTVIAYAYCAAEAVFDPYDTQDPNYDGHGMPYLAGRRNIFTYTGIPHIPDPQFSGITLNSTYGSGPLVQRMQGKGNGGRVLDMTQASINEALAASNNYRVANPIYEAGSGPIDVQVYDPVKVGSHDFEVYLRDTIAYFPTDTPIYNTPNSKWYIKELATGFVDSSDQTIKGASEKLFPQWGIKVNIQQIRMATEEGAVNNGYLESSIEFANDPENSKRWFSGVPDVDRSSFNWILSGTDTCTASCPNLPGPVDHVPFEDPGQVYEKLIGGTWAPFRLASQADNGPTYSSFTHTLAMKLDSICSVDIVVTSDRSKWSRSVVIEMQTDTSKAEGKAAKGDPRKHPSVDKNGNTGDGVVTNDPNDADYISATGMSWFPGYAVNLETGERLNIMFGEDSYLESEGGRDMKFNPTSNFASRYGDILFGGKHCIYVMGRGGSVANSIKVAYDNCAALKNHLDSAVRQTSVPAKRNVKNGAWRDCMWVGYPMLESGHSLFETDVKIRLRVAKSYQNYNAGGVYSGKDATQQGVPYYRFSTRGLEALTDQTEVAKSALDLINVVPNPYYAYSSYERNQLESRVKITNLPNSCTISIYTVTGTLVRRLTRNVPSSTDLSEGIILEAVNNSSVSSETSVDWDLKNSFGVPIGGGVYIIHVDAPGLGEKVIKWFGVMRPIDLDTF